MACNQTTAASGQYGGVAVFFEVTKGPARGGAAAFISWIDHSRRREENHRQPVGPDRLEQWLERLRASDAEKAMADRLSEP